MWDWRSSTSLFFRQGLMYPTRVRNLVFSEGWPWTFGLPVSTSRRLRLMTWTTTVRLTTVLVFRAIECCGVDTEVRWLCFSSVWSIITLGLQQVIQLLWAATPHSWIIRQFAFPPSSKLLKDYGSKSWGPSTVLLSYSLLAMHFFIWTASYTCMMVAWGSWL